MAAKTVDRAFIQGQRVELSWATINSRAACYRLSKKSNRFLRKMDVRSPEAVVRFAKSNPAVAENKIIDFLSSERGRDDHGEISADTINNWIKVARALSNRSSELYCRDTVLLSWYLGCESEIVGHHLGSLVSHIRVIGSVIIVIVAADDGCY